VLARERWYRTRKFTAMASNGPALPPLPKVVTPRCVTLEKTLGDDSWGFVMRGCHERFPDGNHMHTACVTKLDENGPSVSAGLEENDQILAVDDKVVRHMEHEDVVELFKGKTRIELKVLSEKERESVTVQVLPSSVQMLDYLWALAKALHHLFVWQVNFNDLQYIVDLTGLYKLEELAVTHCNLTSLELIHGMPSLLSLTCLSLDHNNLMSDALHDDCPLAKMTQLTKLSINSNQLSEFPMCLLSLTRLTKLSLSYNYILSIPPLISQLTNLKQLNMDANRLIDLEPEVLKLPSLTTLTIADNSIDFEPDGLMTCNLHILRVEGNPYLSHIRTMTGRFKKGLKRTISVTGSCPASTSSEDATVKTAD
jgi:hypothetical protein